MLFHRFIPHFTDMSVNLPRRMKDHLLIEIVELIALPRKTKPDDPSESLKVPVPDDPVWSVLKVATPETPPEHISLIRNGRPV